MRSRFESLYASIKQNPELTPLIPFLDYITKPQPLVIELKIRPGRPIRHRVINFNGDTLLHCLVRQGAPLSLLQLMIKGLGETAVSDMARTINRHGELPIAIIPPTSQANEIYDLINPLTRYNPLNKPDEIIEIADILAKYQPLPDSLLEKNLILATHVHNATRAKQIKSPEHPSLEVTDRERTELKAKTQVVRQACRDTSLAAGLSLLASNNPFRLFNNPGAVLIKRVSEITLTGGAGNCYEQTCIAYTIAKEFDNTRSVQMYAITPGDHAFLIIGDGAERVICDPWAGKVFPYSEMARQLNDFIGNDTSKGIVTEFNPEVQKITPIKLKRDILTNLYLLMFVSLALAAGLYAALDYYDWSDSEAVESSIDTISSLLP